jgi:hypothetical protein
MRSFRVSGGVSSFAEDLQLRYRPERPNNPSSAICAPVVSSVIPLSNQSGTRMHVLPGKVRCRKLGALSFPTSETGGRLYRIDKVRYSSWDDRGGTAEVVEDVGDIGAEAQCGNLGFYAEQF